MPHNQETSEGPREGGPGKVELFHVEEGSTRDSFAKSDAKIENNLTYEDPDVEPEIHFRTWVAVAAMLFLNFVQIIALQGPPVVLANIGESLHNTPAETWVPNALSLVQAVLAPVFSSASDTFQARKLIMVGSCIMSFIGAAIAPGSKDLYRLIGAQILIGFGFSSTALAYCVPSEILPRKWRPMVQSAINVAAATGACVGPLIIGAMSRHDPFNGWRHYYWLQMGLWGLTAVCLWVGYWPPKRHTMYDHLSLRQKISALNLPGIFLFSSGLTLFLVGLNLGGNLYSWTNARTLATLVTGLAVLVGFVLYEWLGTKTGLANHDIFRGGRRAGGANAIYLVLVFVEGVLLFAYMIFYPVLTSALFEKDDFLLAAREQPFWIGGGLSTLLWGYWTVKTKSIRVPLFLGFLIFTSGIIGLATIQPSQSTRACIFAGLAGIGFGAPLILIIAGIQLAVPHRLIATATALAISSRAVASTVSTAVYSAVVNDKLQNNIISHVSKAALAHGLPLSSVKPFVQALAAEDVAALGKIPGVTPVIIESGVMALKQAIADTVRLVFIIAAPFGAVACLLCFLLGDQSAVMTYKVDAPVEDLHGSNEK